MIFVLLIPARYLITRSLTSSHTRSYNYTAPIKFIYDNVEREGYDEWHCQLRSLYRSDGKGMNEYEPPVE
jgi:hypothetical protein